METIFNILCGGLFLIGMALGWNYEEASVYICIYLWPVLCCIFVLMINLAMLYRWIKKNTFMNTIGLSLSTSTTYSFISVSKQFINHYRFYGDNINTVHQQFQICMNDIYRIATNVGITYAEANLYIYIYLFLTIMLFSWLAFELIYPKKWLLNRLWK